MATEYPHFPDSDPMWQVNQPIIEDWEPPAPPLWQQRLPFVGGVCGIVSLTIVLITWVWLGFR